MKPGTTIFVCTDMGVRGPSAQAYSVQVPQCAVHIFDDEDSMREWASHVDLKTTSRKQQQCWWMIVGESHTTGMSLHDHRINRND